MMIDEMNLNGARPKGFSRPDVAKSNIDFIIIRQISPINLETYKNTRLIPGKFTEWHFLCNGL
jgi:hypothetical protein